jgi:hypothetical protein
MQVDPVADGIKVRRSALLSTARKLMLEDQIEPLRRLHAFISGKANESLRRTAGRLDPNGRLGH